MHLHLVLRDAAAAPELGLKSALLALRVLLQSKPGDSASVHFDAPAVPPAAARWVDAWLPRAVRVTAGPDVRASLKAVDPMSIVVQADGAALLVPKALVAAAEFLAAAPLASLLHLADTSVLPGADAAHSVIKVLGGTHWRTWHGGFDKNSKALCARALTLDTDWELIEAGTEEDLGVLRVAKGRMTWTPMPALAQRTDSPHAGAGVEWPRVAEYVMQQT